MIFSASLENDFWLFKYYQKLWFGHSDIKSHFEFEVSLFSRRRCAERLSGVAFRRLRIRAWSYLVLCHYTKDRAMLNRWKWRLFRARLAIEDPRSRAFDLRHGVETAREEPLTEMGVATDAVERGNTLYRVTWGWLIQKAMARLDIDPRRYSFIDYGSGKGKAMLMASDRPFKTIIGLEYARGLHDIAAENCRTYRSANQKCRSFQPILGDALAYDPPPGPLVCFMCNPFDETTLRAVFKNWRTRYEQGEREIRILYLNMRNVAEAADVLGEQDWLRAVARNKRFVVLAPRYP